jgi:hypothetical protein
VVGIAASIRKSDFHERSQQRYHFSKYSGRAEGILIKNDVGKWK